MSGKRSGKKSLVKKKSLFDHVNQVTAVQNPNYWEDISDEDKKTWSNYMVNKKMDYPKWVYEIVAKDMQVSMREAVSAVETYTMSTGGQSELADILLKYGTEDKEIRKLGLI